MTAAWRAQVADRSSYFEIDLVLVADAQDRQRPEHDQIVLGVECKAHENFRKATVKEVLGARRELCFLRSSRNGPLKSLEPLADSARLVNVDPPSEFWLAFVDPKGMRYRAAPAVFGIEFKHWCPP